MKEIYSWVPWFRELAKKIEDRGEAYLIEKAKEVDWGNSRSLLEYGDDNIDPFSFFYFLAQKNTANQRELVYASVNKVFAIGPNPPETGWGNTFIIPTPTPNTAALFHDGKNFNPASLWKLFGQAVKDKPHVKAETFHEALNIPYVGVIKLTQCLFLINPQSFIPIDKSFPNFTSMKGQIEEQNGWNVCLQAIERTKQNFPGCHPYEIARVFYLLHSRQINLKRNFFQISTHVLGGDKENFWDKFKEHNCVYTGGPASSKSWGVAKDGKGYPLTEPVPGDIILVRTGREKGRAIGIVYHNDYEEPDGLNKESSIHVIWLNKYEHKLSGKTPISGFSRAHKTYDYFNTGSYKPTLEFIKNSTKDFIKEEPAPSPDEQEQKPMNHHPVNQILYGPPGTGKTWNTVNHAVAIIDDESVDNLKNKNRKEIKERFNELKDAGQIGMVTFHQNYSYEDFIEGIRPVLSGKQGTANKEQGDKSDIKYELSSGIFKEIVSRAKSDSKKNYVLIIDEINRGNIAKIFGELITLIEESKRLGEKKDEATATLPYSKESFGIPNNLYIIGTMNTADRSIALLDTALRRRFDFVEMMPDPRHSGISKDIQGVNCQKLLEKINERIRILHDRDHQIGHTYFLDVKDLDSLAKTFKNRIIPLLQEYFYDNWEKIDLVLNENGFITNEAIGKKREKNQSLFKKNSELVRDNIDDTRKIYELSTNYEELLKKPDSYIKIYQAETQPQQEAQDNQST